jgi:hypothetical protein
MSVMSVLTVKTAIDTFPANLTLNALPMTFDELLRQANKAQKKFLRSEKLEPISERTLRYWISKGVLEKRSTRGPNTSYPEAFVWRVVLTRMHQLSFSKTLDEIAEIQSNIPDEEARTSVEELVRLLATGSKERPAPQVKTPKIRKKLPEKPAYGRYEDELEVQDQLKQILRELQDVDTRISKERQYRLAEHDHLIRELSDGLAQSSSREAYGYERLESELRYRMNDLETAIHELRDEIRELNKRLSGGEGHQ